MIAKINGNFMESGSYAKKDGTVVPYAVIYSGGESIRVSNVDTSNLKQFAEVELNVRIVSGKYGLFVSAV